jgi:imidazolonepropionase-like amidohydrolase
VSRVAFTNCSVIDVRTGAVLPAQTIIVERERILRVAGPMRYLPDASRVYDMAGCWVLPGLLDVHVHACENPEPLVTTIEYPTLDSAIPATSRRNLLEALRSGVTGLRDLGSYGGRNVLLREAVESGKYDGPTVQACGYLITYPGGHCCNLGIEIRGAEAGREAVRRNAQLGANCIKVTSDPEDVEATGRTPNPAFTLSEYEAIVGQAHDLGLRVAAHTFPSESGMITALDAGVDTVEHGCPLTPAILERLVSRDVVLVPTVVAALDEIPNEILTTDLGPLDEEFFSFEETNYPKNLLAQLRGNQVPESITIWYSRLINTLGAAIESGVCIAIGSDAGCKGTNFRSALREMYFLTKLGASNLQVLQYATMSGARALGESDSRGEIREGFVADLVFVKANPLQRLSALLRPQLVVARGRVYSPDASLL